MRPVWHKEQTSERMEKLSGIFARQRSASPLTRIRVWPGGMPGNIIPNFEKPRLA
jgi:hypothetical protein